MPSVSIIFPSGTDLGWWHAWNASKKDHSRCWVSVSTSLGWKPSGRRWVGNPEEKISEEHGLGVSPSQGAAELSWVGLVETHLGQLCTFLLAFLAVRNWKTTKKRCKPGRKKLRQNPGRLHNNHNISRQWSAFGCDVFAVFDFGRDELDTWFFPVQGSIFQELERARDELEEMKKQREKDAASALKQSKAITADHIRSVSICLKRRQKRQNHSNDDNDEPPAGLSLDKYAHSIDR